jgi:hypothetical protein
LRLRVRGSIASLLEDCLTKHASVVFDQYAKGVPGSVALALMRDELR